MSPSVHNKTNKCYVEFVEMEAETFKTYLQNLNSMTENKSRLMLEGIMETYSVNYIRSHRTDTIKKNPEEAQNYVEALNAAIIAIKLNRRPGAISMEDFTKMQLGDSELTAIATRCRRSKNGTYMDYLLDNDMKKILVM